MSLPRVHPLWIDEILRNVFSHVARDVEESAEPCDNSIFNPLTQSAKTTLIRAALVNKAFQTVALDALYECLDFRSILKVLDHSLSTEWIGGSATQLEDLDSFIGNGDKLAGGVIELESSRQPALAINYERWCMFTAYAGRTLFGYLDTFAVRDREQHGPVTVFPCLSYLEIIDETCTTVFPWVRRLLCPSLRELHITNPNLDHAFNDPNLPKILATVPNLRALLLDGAIITDECLSSVSALKYLKNAHLSSVSDVARVMDFLGMLKSTLTCVELYIDEPKPIDISERHRSIVLPKLKVLYIAGNIRAVGYILQRIELPGLEKITVVVDTKNPPEDRAGSQISHTLITPFTRFISDVQAISSAVVRYDILRILELDYYLEDFIPLEKGEPVPFSELVEPLLRGEHPSWETLQVAMDGATDAVRFSDEDVLRLAKVCPHVEEFSISLGYHFAATVPTLLSLRRLPEHLPELKELRLSIGPSEADTNSLLDLRNNDGSAKPARWVQFPHVTTLQLYVPTEPYDIFDATISGPGSPIDLEPNDSDDPDLDPDTDYSRKNIASPVTAAIEYDEGDCEDNLIWSIRTMVEMLFPNLDPDSCRLDEDLDGYDVWNEVLYRMRLPKPNSQD